MLSLIGHCCRDWLAAAGSGIKHLYPPAQLIQSRMIQVAGPVHVGRHQEKQQEYWLGWSNSIAALAVWSRGSVNPEGGD